MLKKVCFVSVSGGKDSTLCLALALERYRNTDVPVVAVFADTKWEHPITYKYLEELESIFKIKIHRVGYEGGIPELLRKFKIFPSPRKRFCTSVCKTVPIYKFYEQIYFATPFKVAEVWYGLRKDESYQRKNIKDWILPAGERTRFKEKFAFTIHFRYPIKDLPEHQVFRELRKRNIPVNPLYSQGFNRIGCYPCFLSRKDILLVISKALEGDEFSRMRLKEMIELDKEIGERKINIDYSLDELIQEAKRKHEVSKRMLSLF